MTWRDRIREFVAAGLLIIGVGSGAVLATGATSDATLIRIGAFNIQVFGQTKAGNDAIMDVLARTAREFDVLLVQEVRDAKQEVAGRFLERINRDITTPYAMIEGPRLGRTNSKEQYVFYYRPSVVTFVDSFTVQDVSDVWEREPLVARFRAGTFDFRLIGIHIKPDQVRNELAELAELADSVRTASESDVIMLGDFNADCSYLNEADNSIPLRQARFHWVIGNGVETAVKSGCTYDRMIMFDGTFADEYEPNSAQVLRYDQEFGITDQDFIERVSDHYPIYAEFRINRPDDDGTGAAPATTAAPFVGSRLGHTYYKAGCSGARGLSPANIVEFSSAQDAEAQGYHRSQSAGC